MTEPLIYTMEPMALSESFQLKAPRMRFHSFTNRRHSHTVRAIYWLMYMDLSSFPHDETVVWRLGSKTCIKICKSS